MMNAAPPFAPVMDGNFQMFPNPTAEPRVAKMTPNLLVNESRTSGLPGSFVSLLGGLVLVITLISHSPNKNI
jgi:hypothetical protein